MSREGERTTGGTTAVRGPAATGSPGGAARLLATGWPGGVARLLLAAVLAYAGLAKIGDLTGAGRVVALYRIVPDDSAQLVGGILPFVELALAMLLALGLATRAAAVGAAVLLTAYIAAVASVWARGLSIDCGCFGGAGRLGGGAERGYALDIARDLVLLGVALLLVRRPRTPYALDGWVLHTPETKE
ncbi:MauE/DoxX family redox-associated membrane protein [Streptomyces sp. NPDC001153]